MIDWMFVFVTGFIAFHGITYRDKNGQTEIVHLLFGCIALLYCLRVLFVDILKII